MFQEFVTFILHPQYINYVIKITILTPISTVTVCSLSEIIMRSGNIMHLGIKRPVSTGRRPYGNTVGHTEIIL